MPIYPVQTITDTLPGLKRAPGAVRSVLETLFPPTDTSAAIPGTAILGGAGKPIMGLVETLLKRLPEGLDVGKELTVPSVLKDLLHSPTTHALPEHVNLPAHTQVLVDTLHAPLDPLDPLKLAERTTSHRPPVARIAVEGFDVPAEMARDPLVVEMLSRYKAFQPAIRSETGQFLTRNGLNRPPASASMSSPPPLSGRWGRGGAVAKQAQQLASIYPKKVPK